MISIHSLRSWFPIIAMLGTVALSSGQEVSSPTDLAVMLNTRNLECTLSLDHEAFLPWETAVVRATVRNPTHAAMVVRTPFELRNGQFYITRVSEAGGEEGTPWDDGGLQPAPRLFPTTVLQPSQEVTTTVLTTAKGSLHIPGTSGRYRLKYSYDERAGADFRVVAISEAKLRAISMVRLPAEEFYDYEAQQKVMRQPHVAFFAVETSPTELWLYRSDPDFRGQLSPGPSGEYTLGRLINQVMGLQRVRKLDGRPLTLQSQMRADDTADVIVHDETGRQVVLNVPARPTRLSPDR
jgi:hypothetical protein